MSITPSSTRTLMLSTGTSTPSTESSLALSVSDTLENPFEPPADPQPDPSQQPAASNFITPHQPLMLAPITAHSFSGEPGDDMQSGEFLKTFRRFMTYAHIMENDRIIESFGDHLKYASPADKWFHELNTELLMWKDVERAFLQRFPPVGRAKRVETELERELSELEGEISKLRLKVEDLRKKEKEERERTEAVIAGLQCMQEQQQHCPPTAPMLPMLSALQSTTLGGQHNNQNATSRAPQVATIANTNLLTSPSGGQGNLFLPPPVQEAEQDVLNRSLAAYPLQPNTPTGAATWRNQLHNWKAKNGKNTQVTASTGFPLQPGGAPPGSGECYGCGLVGHRQSQCTAKKINNRERAFRIICGRILRPAAITQVNIGTGAAGEFDWLNDQVPLPALR